MKLPIEDTKELLYQAKKDNALIVCANPDTLRKKAYEYEIMGLRFCSYLDYINTTNRLALGDIYIDDIELYLNIITNRKLKGYTIR